MILILTLFDPASRTIGPVGSRGFDRHGVTIGRDPENGWVLPDPLHHLSEQQCVITFENDRYVITDTSAGGVFVNEARAPLGQGNSAVLKHGDRIALGDYLFSVALADRAPSEIQAPAASAVSAPAAEPEPAAISSPPDASETREPAAPAPAVSEKPVEPPSQSPTGFSPAGSEPPVTRAVEPESPPRRAPARGRDRDAEGSDVALAAAPGETAEPRPRPTLRRSAAAEPREPDGSAQLVAAFLTAAGLPLTPLSRQQAMRLMTAAGASLQALTEGLQELLQQRAATPTGKRLEPTLQAAPDHPLLGARTADELLAQLLGLRRSGDMSASVAIRTAIEDLKTVPVATAAPAAVPRRRWLIGALGILVLLGAAAAAVLWAPLIKLAAVRSPEIAIADTPPPAPTPPPTAAAPPPSQPLPAAPSPPPPAAAAPQPPPPAAVAAAPSAPPARPALDRERLQAEIRGVFRGFACADISAEIGDNGAVTISGYVSRPDDPSRLQSQVAGVPGVSRVDSRATLLAWPFCELLNLLRDRSVGGAPAPQLEPSHADHVYRDGDALMVDAVARGGPDRYLYVDYYDTDGNVVHMLPTRLRADNRTGPNEHVTLGAERDQAGRNQRVYIASPPFGTSLLVALSTPQPLFAQPRPEQEPARAYLTALADALHAQREDAKSAESSGIGASYQFVTLTPR